MIQVDRSLFSNVMSSVQRTSNLTGGGVSGLPNGVVIRGLEGVASFGSDIQDAQKEFEKGRVRSSLERIRQLESLFQSIVGRWNSTVMTVIAGAKTGKQQLSIQKLNEVKSAQTKMQQLTRPATKSFQDLITALELALTNEGRKDLNTNPSSTPDSEPSAPESDQASLDDHRSGDQETKEAVNDNTGVNAGMDPEDPTPDSNLLGQFAVNYLFGQKLQIRRVDGKVGIDPKFEANKFYFFCAMEPPRVLRVREIQRSALLVFDSRASQEFTIEGQELKEFLKKGVWQLIAKSTKR